VLPADDKAEISFRIGVRLRPYDGPANAFNHDTGRRYGTVRQPDTAAQVNLLLCLVGKSTRLGRSIAERRLIIGLPAAATLLAGRALWRRCLTALRLAETYRCKGNDESAKRNCPDTTEPSSPCHGIYLRTILSLLGNFQ